jgi:CHAD domain-containing protein
MGTPTITREKRRQRCAPARGKKSGLGYWMLRVLKECARADRDLSADAVHDLRVALRRCRSMADGLMVVDSDREWREMKRAGRRLFRRLGGLRDTQVMAEWVRKLAPEDNPVRQKMLELLVAREQQQRADAGEALAAFDRRQWKQWGTTLADRAARVPLGGLVFQHLALERWQEAHALHRRALRYRSRPAWHVLRIGLKRLRYTVENFLPRLHRQWGEDLKRLQDLLGEVHDLDVLWDELRKTGEIFDASQHQHWREWIDAERNTRLEEYRAKMVGKDSLWNVWRKELPAARRLETAALTRLTTWAAFLDRDFVHARQVSELALELYDGLRHARIPGAYAHPRASRILQAAALLHEVGKAKGKRGHHKATYREITALAPPTGWSEDELKWIALVARYHRGTEPRNDHPGFEGMLDNERQAIYWLAGVLRLANAFDGRHDSSVTQLEVKDTPEAIVVRANGLNLDESAASLLAGRKHLLEVVLKRPILVVSAGDKKEGGVETAGALQETSSVTT